MRRPLVIMVWFASMHAGAADLVSIYREAMQNDSVLAAAQAQRRAGDERVPQARAGLLPSLSLNAQTNWNDLEVSNRAPTLAIQGRRQYNNNGYSLSLSQPLFRWQNWVAFEQGKLQEALAEVQFNQARQDLILRVAQAYFDVLFAEEALKSASALKTATEQQRALARQSFEVGTVTITDVHEAQSRFDLASAQEISAKSDVEVKRNALRQLIGREPDGLKPLRRGAVLSRPEPEAMPPWVEAAERAAFPVAIGELNLAIAERERERQRSGHYPTLDLVASYGESGAGQSTFGAGSDTRSKVIGLQLAIPVYAGGAVSSREREAAALRDKAMSDLDTARRTAAQSARSAFLAVTSGLAQIRALEAALVSSQSALDANKLGYEVGVRVNIDVLNAQQQLSTTERDLARARLDTLLSQLRLKSVTAALSEDDLAAINALLE